MIEDLHPREELSELADGELDDSRRAAIEVHLATCAACASVVADLQALARAAGTLEDRPPRKDLWPGIAARLDVIPLERRVRRVTLSWTQLAAAAIAMVLIGGGSVWLAFGGRGAMPGGGLQTPAERRADGDLTAEATFAADFADESYALAVADLERALEASRDRLDPETVAVLERNIEAIDQAIGETRRALAADPHSMYLSEHLAAQMRRKLDVLRSATTLIQASL